MFKLLIAFVVFGVINATYYHLNNEEDHEDHKDQGYSIKLMSSDNGHSDQEEDDHSYSDHSHTVSAAVKTKRYHSVIPVKTDDEESHEKVIEVKPYRQPFRIVFKTRSNPVKVEQIHQGNPGGTEHSKSEDEPHRVHHEVLRPVIQEIKEIIQPYRKVVQEVRPVLEELKTIVSKNDGNGRHSSDEDSNGSRNSYKKRSEKRMNSKPILQLSYKDQSDESKDDNNSDRKQRYQTERISMNNNNEKSHYRRNEDSSEGNSMDSRKYKRFTKDDTSSILEQMNNIMAASTWKVEQPLVGEQSFESPWVALNAGSLKLSRRTGRLPNDLKWAETFPRGYWIRY